MVAPDPEPVKAVTIDLKVGLDRTLLRHKENFTMATNKRRNEPRWSERTGVLYFKNKIKFQIIETY